MKDFNVTIGDVTANTDMIEEDVVRQRMGLRQCAIIEPKYNWLKNREEEIKERMNMNLESEEIEFNKIADEVFEKLQNDYDSSAKEVEEMIKQMPDKAAKLLLIKIVRRVD